jgi:CubicO group peptidase (beta-lactamase class C family)
MRLPILLAALAIFSASAQTPQFKDPARKAKLQAAFPEVDKVFQRYHDSRKIPGSAWGIVIDGELVYTRTYGFRDLAAKDAVNPDTAFRIASMTKSFTAAAVLKLRDEGKLSLEDRVDKWIPEFKGYKYPTGDTGPLRIRQLLNHGAGFPEDNPWGDRQMGEPLNTLGQWVKKGIPFSTPPDSEFEYSNYGFALAGQVVAKASGMPYRKYVESKILAPLGMTASSLEPSALPANVRATGYGLRDNNYFDIPSLPHGSFGSMGGLVTTAKDLAKWVAFQLSAFPPRDDADTGPVQRASLREMQRQQRASNFSSDRNRSMAGSYGFGLSVSQDCRFHHIVGHGGGLPGFGSYMMWLPEYGVGMIAMTNLTYAGPASALSEAFDALAKTGALQPRELEASPVLISTRDSIASLWNKWDDQVFDKLAANNLPMDLPGPARKAQVEALKRATGACQPPNGIQPENWLRGRFRMSCENGEVETSFTLAPTNPPTVQYLHFEHIGSLSPAMRAYAEETAAKLSCRIGETLGGDGKKEAAVRLLGCAAPSGSSQALALLKIDGETKTVQFRRAPGAACLAPNVP